MVFATSAASFVLVIGRRFLVKSMVGIYGGREISGDRGFFLSFTFDCQGKHPTG